MTWKDLKYVLYGYMRHVVQYPKGDGTMCYEYFWLSSTAKEAFTAACDLGVSYVEWNGWTVFGFRWYCIKMRTLNKIINRDFTVWPDKQCNYQADRWTAEGEK